MADVNVKGIGVLTFPDNFTEAQIEQAIKEHPKYKEAEKANSPSFVEKLPIVGKHFSKVISEADKFTEKNPSVKEFGKFDPFLRDVLGSTLTQAATGPGTLVSMAGQGAYGAGSKAKDIYDEKGLNFDTQDIMKILMSGGVSSMAPLIGRGLSPNVPKGEAAPVIPPMGSARAKKPEPILSKDPAFTAKKDQIHRAFRGDPKIQETERMMNENIAKMKALKEAAQRKTVPETIAKYVGKASDSVMPAIAGGVLGHYAAGSPFIGAAVGAASPHVKNYAMSKMPEWWGNSIMHGPAQSMILNTLLRESGDVAGSMVY